MIVAGLTGMTGVPTKRIPHAIRIIISLRTVPTEGRALPLHQWYSMLLTCLGVVPLILAAFGFLFGSLAYRKGRRSNRLATHGMLASCLGIISAVIMLVQLFTLPIDGTQTSYSQLWQQYIEQMQ